MQDSHSIDDSEAKQIQDGDELSCEQEITDERWENKRTIASNRKIKQKTKERLSKKYNAPNSGWVKFSTECFYDNDLEKFYEIHWYNHVKVDDVECKYKSNEDTQAECLKREQQRYAS